MDQKKFDLWFSEAENDFEIGTILFNAQKYNAAVFHFVQAAEKAVKSLLYYKGITAWGHSIVDLLNSCEKIQISVNKNIKNIAQKLEKHYSSSRYPDALPDLTPKEAYDDSIAEDIQQKSQKILDFVTKERENIDIKEKQKSDKNKTEDLNNDFE